MTADSRRRVLLTMALLAACGAAVFAQASRTASPEFDRAVDTSAGAQLRLDLPAGGDVFLQGWDENRVAVRVRLGGRNWQDTDVALERVRGGVRLSARLARLDATASTAHRFDIRVPRRYNLQIDSAGGKIRIRDVEGTLSGHTAGGSIELERVRGRAELATGGGEIRVRDADVDGFVTTGGGRVSVEGNRGRLRTEGGRQPAGRLPQRISRSTSTQGSVRSFSNCRHRSPQTSISKPRTRTVAEVLRRLGATGCYHGSRLRIGMPRVARHDAMSDLAVGSVLEERRFA
jgi:hypothetical protein